jgi:hypothetical protein
VAKFEPFQIPEIDVEPFLKAMAEAVRPIKLGAVALEAIEEVSSAHRKHGPNADLADGTGPLESILDDAHVVAVTNSGAAMALQRLNDKACARNRTHTRLGILLEEAFEAAEADSPTELRKELIQVAAMALDWIVDIDDRHDDDIDEEG